jgi:hypothetical protein
MINGVGLRIELTEEDVKKGWEVERLLEPSMILEMIVLPDGTVVTVIEPVIAPLTDPASAAYPRV